jgi:hypothetical protein
MSHLNSQDGSDLGDSPGILGAARIDTSLKIIPAASAIAKEAIERAQAAADPSKLPSSPIAANTELYEGARAMAIVAGVIEADQWPEELLYNHSTKQWHVRW